MADIDIDASFQELSDCIIKGDAPGVDRLVKACLEADVSPGAVINDGMIPGMDVVGELFRTNQYYVPEVLISARAMKTGMAILRPLLTESGGTLHAAGSIGELALRAGLDTGALEVAVADFNAAVKEGRAGTLAPARTVDRYTPVPIETPPFHAIPLAAGITVTMGGIAVDGAARVLRPDDSPIPGLYAAGSTVGGVEGGPDAAYIGGLIKAFLLGLVAAETAAREIGAGD